MKSSISHGFLKKFYNSSKINTNKLRYRIRIYPRRSREKMLNKLQHRKHIIMNKLPQYLLFSTIISVLLLGKLFIYKFSFAFPTVFFEVQYTKWRKNIFSRKFKFLIILPFYIFFDNKWNTNCTFHLWAIRSHTSYHGVCYACQKRNRYSSQLTLLLALRL